MRLGFYAGVVSCSYHAQTVLYVIYMLKSSFFFGSTKIQLLYNYFERPSSLSDEKGCILSVNDGDTNLEMGESLSVPLSVIDAGKVCCLFYFNILHHIFIFCNFGK